MRTKQRFGPKQRGKARQGKVDVFDANHNRCVCRLSGVTVGTRTAVNDDVTLGTDSRGATYLTTDLCSSNNNNMPPANLPPNVNAVLYTPADLWLTLPYMLATRNLRIVQPTIRYNGLADFFPAETSTRILCFFSSPTSSRKEQLSLVRHRATARQKEGCEQTRVSCYGGCTIP